MKEAGGWQAASWLASDPRLTLIAAATLQAAGYATNFTPAKLVQAGGGGGAAWTGGMQDTLLTGMQRYGRAFRRTGLQAAKQALAHGPVNMHPPVATSSPCTSWPLPATPAAVLKCAKAKPRDAATFLGYATAVVGIAPSGIDLAKITGRCSLL